jgi:hypothetical protein
MVFADREFATIGNIILTIQGNSFVIAAKLQLYEKYLK